jgi:hypothetical protein
VFGADIGLPELSLLFAICLPRLLLNSTRHDSEL